jgi:predicted DCC family thiol-disulfide oxidoreductase YuxK
MGSVAPQALEPVAPQKITLLYDAACPMCSREVRMINRFNGEGNLLLEDISAPGFDASRYGLTQKEVMGHIHAIRADGKAVTGMEAFRQCYAAVGLGFLMAPTGWPMLRTVFDRGYEWFAQNRLKLTGRGHVCESQTCKVHANSVHAESDNESHQVHA